MNFSQERGTMRRIAGVLLLCFMIAGAFFWIYDSRKAGRDSVEPDLTMSVKPAEISEETKRILNVIGNVRLFDLKMDPEQVFMIKIWVEHFERGGQQENVIDYSSGILPHNDPEESGKLHHEQLLFILSENRDEPNKERRLSITSALIDEEGSGSTAAEMRLPLLTGGQVTWMNSSELELHLNQPVTLGSIIEFDGHTVNPGAGSVQEYDATGELPEELKRHERVFLFRMMLQGHE